VIDLRTTSAARWLQKRIANIKGPIVLDGQIPPRMYAQRVGTVNVDGNTALKNSTFWACLRLRADLISTFPLDVYRDDKALGGRIDVTAPQVLRNPGGIDWPLIHWLWATQFDLDRYGNAFGIISARTPNNLPAQIDLQDAARAQVIHKQDGTYVYKFGNSHVEYAPENVWHEKAYPVAGLHIGLSPVMHAAWTLGESMSMQDFALQWFGNGGMPKASLQHTSKKIDGEEARRIKDRYMATVNHGDIFVHGMDWVLSPMQADKMGTMWIEGRRYDSEEICRYLGVPTDLVDATAGVGSNIKYANITQQHMKFLVLNLGPAVARREMALTTLTAQPRYVKLNTDAIMRMDPLQRAQYITALLAAKLITNTEGRSLDDRPPLTAEQESEFTRLYGPPSGLQPPQMQQPTTSDDTKA
jgi:HK97 family phage portal protein